MPEIVYATSGFLAASQSEQGVNEVPWTNPEPILVADGVCAGAEVGNVLVATTKLIGTGLATPPDPKAIVTGFKVLALGKCAVASADLTACYLYAGGREIAVNRNPVALPVGTADWMVWGDETDLWGGAIITDALRSPSFRVGIVGNNLTDQQVNSILIDNLAVGYWSYIPDESSVTPTAGVPLVSSRRGLVGHHHWRA